MTITITQTVSAATDAEGLVVIIDVLRVCTTLSVLFDRGTKEVIPVRTVEEASAYVSKEYVLIGEGENGIVDTTFQYNNSPSEVLAADVSGRVVVLRSNNATQAILNAGNAQEIVLACFLNARAVAEYVKQQAPNVVTIVALGRKGAAGLEDDLCAEVIKAEILDEVYDFSVMKPQIENCDCALLVRNELGKPEDVTMALALNKYNIVPKVFDDGGKKVIRAA